RIGRLRVLRSCVAPVFFQVVNTPGGVLPCVLELVAAASCPPGTSLGARVCINAEFQTAGVHIVRQRLDARWKQLCIRLDVAVVVPPYLPPALNYAILTAQRI